mmetsp:Transcript_1311/g.1681  ORF Transcript_1311/g.1681 Transcript_1311/m.1681 type:complete len:88 (-) Transcript_1311:884-1147(-)
MNWQKTPDPAKRPTSIVGGWNSLGGKSRDNVGDCSISQWRQKLNKIDQDRENTKDANEVLLCDMLEQLRKKIDEIEGDKWLYEDKPF